jgi:hypothetical protein
MFYCQVTKRQSKPLEKVNRLVVATREKTYFEKFRNEETGKLEDIEVGRGWEIVKEINACQEGADVFNAMSLEERAAFVKGLP